VDRDRALGALLGAAVGDALGMPVDGLSHQNVRLYYRGIKGYTADEKRLDLRAGQWTAHTQRQAALARFLAADPLPADAFDPEAALDFFGGRPREDAFLVELAMVGEFRRYDPSAGAYVSPRGTVFPAPTSNLAATIAPLGVWAAARGVDDEALAMAVHELFWLRASHPLTLVAAAGQARAIARALTMASEGDGGVPLLRVVVEAARAAEALNDAPAADVSRRLHDLALHLEEPPLDLQDRCNGTGARADEAFPFAVAMFARNAALVEATLLSAVNVGGAASAVGAMTGALLGAFNGWRAFPAEWREGLEDVARLEAEAAALMDALG
jgi:ADP-ribosylglycohydrolase